jgi:hypothetical protein
MLHIVMCRGLVLQVYKLAETPDKDPLVLKEEEDYKIEYCPNEDAVELHHVKKPKPVKRPKRLNQDWLKPKVYKGKSMHEEEVESQS